MNMSLVILFAVSFVVLAVLADLIYIGLKKPTGTKISPLTSVAIVLASSGTIFSGDRLLSYSLLGASMLIAVIELWRVARRR